MRELTQGTKCSEFCPRSVTKSDVKARRSTHLVVEVPDSVFDWRTVSEIRGLRIEMTYCPSYWAYRGKQQRPSGIYRTKGRWPQASFVFGRWQRWARAHWKPIAVWEEVVQQGDKETYGVRLGSVGNKRGVTGSEEVQTWERNWMTI